MQKAIANIISTSSKIDFDFKYNKCKSLEEIDHSLPTLIVGYDTAKRYIKNFRILKKHYPEQRIWWTFMKTEKRVDYDKDINDFHNIIIDEITKGVEYSLIDVINFTKEEKENIWNMLMSDKDKVVYNYYNKFLFIYNKEEKKVYGLPLTTCRFIGKNTDKIIDKMKNNVNNEFVYDFSNIPSEIRRKLETNIHYLVVLNEYFC